MKNSKKTKATKTSSFGSPGRTNHNSTTFYSSKLHENMPKEQKVEYAEQTIPAESYEYNNGLAEGSVNKLKVKSY